MKRRIVVRLIILFGLVLINSDLMAQNPVCAYCGTPLPNGVHASGCKYYIAPASGAKTGSSESLNTLVVGALFQGLLNSMFKSDSKNQKEQDAKQKAAAFAAQQEVLRAVEQQRINEQIAQEKYIKMMKSYKLLDDSHEMGVKTLNTTKMDFKTLDEMLKTYPIMPDYNLIIPVYLFLIPTWKTRRRFFSEMFCHLPIYRHWWIPGIIPML